MTHMGGILEKRGARREKSVWKNPKKNMDCQSWGTDFFIA